MILDGIALILWLLHIGFIPLKWEGQHIDCLIRGVSCQFEMDIDTNSRKSLKMTYHRPQLPGFNQFKEW